MNLTHSIRGRANSLNSWWVDNEVLSAFEKEQGLMKEREEKIGVLIPLDLDGFVFSKKWTRDYKKQVQSRSVACFKEWEQNSSAYQSELKKLVAAMRADDGAREQPPTSLL